MKLDYLGSLETANDFRREQRFDGQRENIDYAENDKVGGQRLKIHTLDNITKAWGQLLTSVCPSSIAKYNKAYSILKHKDKA